MKRRERYFSVSMIAAFSALMVLFTGCLMNDNENCPVSVNLRFVYTLNPEYVDEFADEVLHTDLLVYDGEGKLFLAKRFQLSEMTSSLLGGRSVKLALPVGKYTVIAWGNFEPTDYTLLSTSTLAAMQISLMSDNAGNVTRLQSPLFHGMTTVEVADDYQETEKLVEMIKDVHDINVILYANAPVLHNWSGYTFEIKGSNGTYRNDNTKEVSSTLTYTPIQPSTPWQEGDKVGIKASIRTMRLFQGDDLRILIKRDGVVRYEAPLTSLLLQHPTYTTNEDLDRYDEYELRFLIDSTISLISVNDWNVVVENGGI